MYKDFASKSVNRIQKSDDCTHYYILKGKFAEKEAVEEH